MFGNRLSVAVIAAALLLTGSTNAAQPFKSPAKSHPGVTISGLDKSSSSAREKAGDDATSKPKIIPNAYIIELDSGASLTSGSGNLHARFHKRAEEENIKYEIRREFTDASLFHGLSVELSQGDSKDALEALPEVKKVWPVVEIAHPTPAGYEGLDIGKPVGSDYGYNTTVIRGENYKIDYNLKMAGVDNLHSRGIKGKGVKVAIIDSGVDYRHPALGGGFGPGKKVAFGRNYVDDGQGGPEDPIATCSSGGHGSHVAGIIAGEDPKDVGFGLLGVAPEATLGMYRVFSCGGGANSDVILQAMIDAVNDGAQIISMSLGSDNGWERLDPFGPLVTNAKKQGVAVIIAAGNSGRLGPFLTGSPAIAEDAVAVASADAARYPTTYKVKGSNGGEWRYARLWPLEGEFNIYAPPKYDDSTGCRVDIVREGAAFVEENGWNISNTIFMFQQSAACPPSGNQINANFLGFSQILSWRDQEFENPYDNDYVSSSPSSFIMSMDYKDGSKLYEAVTADPVGFRLRFSDRRFLAVDNPSAGLTSNYSSMGNTWEFNAFKPLLSAPGHLILSSWPLETGGYAIISGTSMATPFVSGCYALLIAAYPDLSVDEITNLFTTTAQPSKYWGNREVIHAVSHQGAGMINAWNAYNSGTKFQNGALVLGQSAKPVARNITFTNTLGRSKTFEVSHAPAGLMQRTPYSDLDPVGWYVYGFPSRAIYADVEFKTPTTITLGPGESAVVSIVVKPPQGVDPDTIPLYSGYINFVSGRDTYNVPYMGLPYVINEVPVLERDIVTDRLLPAMVESLDEEGQPVYTDKDVVVYDMSDNIPIMVYFARQPSDAYRLDLVAANTTFTPTYYGFNKSNEIETSTPDLPVLDNFAGVDSMSVVLQEFYLQPVYHFLGWYGSLNDANGEETGFVVPGDYRWLLRVLPIEKSYDDADSWISWLSPVMRIVDSSSPGTER